MASTSYGGKRIIPAPFISIEKTYDRTESGEKIGSRFTITVNGNLVSYKGSPNSTGEFYTGGKYDPDARDDPTYVETIDDNAKISSLIRKQEALRNLFKDEGLSFEVQGFDGTQPLKCNPRIVSINFQEGLWVNVVPYTIVMECDIVSINGILDGEDTFSEFISSASESWQIETDETPVDVDNPRMYRMTHSISAKGKTSYNGSAVIVNQAWEEARTYVNARLGLDISKLTSTAILDLNPSSTACNHSRSETIDELGGNYSVTETWLLVNGTAQEDFTISRSESLDGGTIKVSIQGNINGFEVRDSNMDLITSKYENASTKWDEISDNVFTRAQTYAGDDLTLNVNPLSFSLAKNPAAGTINYSYEFDNRPSNILANSKSEVVAVTDNFDIDIFAAITVLGRAAGPVLQPIGTKQANTKNLNMEFVMPIPTGTLENRLNASPFIAGSSDIQAIVNFVRPISPKVFVSDQTASWNINTGRASLNITWTYGT